MKKLAIVGASGLVGQMVLKVLKEENLLDEFEMYLIVSNRHAGQVLVFDDKHYRLVELDEKCLSFGFDFVVFVTGEDISKVWAERFALSGAVVIDNSSAFRLQKGIPLVVPEINLNEITSESKIIANPNCSTIQLVLVLNRLLKVEKIDTIVVSSYQSVSGAGKDAIIDLENDTRNIFKCGIKDNFIAQIGDIAENLNCAEENKIICESKKILNTNFNIVATTVRVPIRFCHGESVYVKFEKDIDFVEIKNTLKCDYLTVCDDLSYPKDCAGSNQTFVCRLRKHSDREIVFFVVADNLRRGAAFNAVEILKSLKN